MMVFAGYPAVLFSDAIIWHAGRVLKVDLLRGRMWIVPRIISWTSVPPNYHHLGF